MLRDRADRLRRHRRRRPRPCSPSRASSSAPAALQHPAAGRQVLPLRRDQPRRGVPARLLHARAPPRRTAPTSARSRARSACARRSTCSASSSSTAPARAPSRAAAPAVPCLDYYIKRCQAPCVGYIDQEEYRANIEAIIDFLSGRYREIERDLEEQMAEAAEAAGVRAGGALPRPAAAPSAR